MSDNLNLRGTQDRSRISMREDHEVRYWTEALGVTKDQLEKVILEVGNEADAVRKALGK